MINRLLARPWIILAVAMVAQVAIFTIIQRDLLTADPVSYAANASELAFHPSEFFARHDNHPFAMRLGLTAPIALMYRLFGASPFVTNVIGLLAGLLIMAIAYAAASSPRARLLAVLFAMTCTPLLAEGRELTADLPCAAAMAVTIFCLSRRDRPCGRWWLVGAVVAWFAAFQIKESAVWLAPVWGYAVIVDLRDRGWRPVVTTLAPSVGVGAGLVVAYLAFCSMFWGDPLARLTGIQQVSSVHAWSLVGHPAAQWTARLTWQPAVLLFDMFHAALVPLVLSPWLVRGRNRIWLVATATIIVMYWFGSSTTRAYMPLPLFPRMLLPALPGIVVLSALAIDAVLDRIRNARWRLALVVVLAACLVVPHVRSLRRIAFRDRPDTAAFAALRSEVESTTERIVLVCGDGDVWCPSLTDYYFGYARPDNLVVIIAHDFAAAPLPAAARVRLFVNVRRSRERGEELVRHAEALGLRPIVSYPKIRLYDAGDGAQLHEALSSLK